MTSESQKKAMRKYMQRKREEYRAAGLCPACGKETGGYYRCEKCRATHNIPRGEK